MALTIKRVTLWRAEVDNQPGVLARTLAPLAAAGASLRVVMGYRLPDSRERAAIELYPVTGRRATEAARQGGVQPAAIPCLLVEGDDRPGLGAGMAHGLADAGLNIAFLVAQVIGRRFSAIIGFDAAESLDEATRAIKAAARAPRARGGRRGR